eukprot:965241-Rhodomonas_salina.1
MRACVMPSESSCDMLRAPRASHRYTPSENSAGRTVPLRSRTAAALRASAPLRARSCAALRARNSRSA